MADIQMFVYATKADVRRVLDEMVMLLDLRGFVTMGDLRELSGIPRNNIDDELGWSKMDRFAIAKVKEGWALVLGATPIPRAVA